MKNQSLEDIGKRIELEKVRLNLKNLDICLILDIHPNTYRNYETGKRDMPISLLLKLWDKGFDLIYILTGRNLNEWEEKSGTSVVGGNSSSSSGTRLIPDQTPYEIQEEEEKSGNKLISKMYEVETSLQKVGAVAKEDYSYVDLARIASQIENYK